MDKYLDSIVAMLKIHDEKIECYLEDRLKLVNVSDIYYIASFDNKTFVFCEKNKYQTKLRLYQLVEKLSGSAFIQISKYCIVDFSHNGYCDIFIWLFNKYGQDSGRFKKN